MPKKADLTIDEQMTIRLGELKQIYASLSEEKMSLALPLMENAVFIEFQLKELQLLIRGEGFTDEYQNGNNQYGKKQSANVQSYNALVKSYNMINQRLEAMLPPSQKGGKLDKFLND